MPDASIGTRHICQVSRILREAPGILSMLPEKNMLPENSLKARKLPEISRISEMSTSKFYFYDSLHLQSITSFCLLTKLLTNDPDLGL